MIQYCCSGMASAIAKGFLTLDQSKLYSGPRNVPPRIPNYKLVKSHARREFISIRYCPFCGKYLGDVK